MQRHKLSFGSVFSHSKDIAEIVINEGIEINEEMVNEIHDHLLNNLTSPFYLLVNKINSYTYDFHAQIKLAYLDEINALAVVSYNQITTDITKMMVKNRKPEWEFKLFSAREDGLKWLEQQQLKTDI